MAQYKISNKNRYGLNSGMFGTLGICNLAFRRGTYERLKKQAFSPYSIPWNTELNWIPDVSGNERTVTKELLKHYRDDY